MPAPGVCASHHTRSIVAYSVEARDRDAIAVQHLRVVRSGAVEIVYDGRVLDLLGEGELFGHASMLSGLPTGFAARALEIAAPSARDQRSQARWIIGGFFQWRGEVAAIDMIRSARPCGRGSAGPIPAE